ncbi:MAG: acyl-CoA thioesterase [Saprospiraceae bacterium]|nr:acyl-CoA thioesterase [Saprospiraceae bacterium]
MEQYPELIPKTVSASQTVMTELMIPAYANFGGKIHGGILLSMMDKAAYACAAKHAGGYCVTVSVEGVEFKAPISVGELVSIHASVNYVGRTSLVIGMRVTSENVETGAVKHTNTSYFTMVAKDKNGEPTPVPPLLLENKEDARRFLEAMKRKELKAQFKDEFDNEKSSLKITSELHLLDAERCVVGF